VVRLDWRTSGQEFVEVLYIVRKTVSCYLGEGSLGHVQDIC
jgi:hypothetical protein